MDVKLLSLDAESRQAAVADLSAQDSRLLAAQLRASSVEEADYYAARRQRLLAVLAVLESR